MLDLSIFILQTKLNLKHLSKFICLWIVELKWYKLSLLNKLANLWNILKFKRYITSNMNLCDRKFPVTYYVIHNPFSNIEISLFLGALKDLINYQ